MNLITIINDGDEQIVRIPKQFQFDTDEVIIRKTSNGLLITPKPNPVDSKAVWDKWIENLSQFKGDIEAR